MHKDPKTHFSVLYFLRYKCTYKCTADTNAYRSNKTEVNEAITVPKFKPPNEPKETKSTEATETRGQAPPRNYLDHDCENWRDI